MKINEELSVLFWLKKAKKTKEGLIPIWVRITINEFEKNSLQERRSYWKTGMTKQVVQKLLALTQGQLTVTFGKPR